MKLTVAALVIALGLPLVVLPSLGRNIYLSPDETAVASSAAQFVKTGSFRIPLALPTVPDLHPRSVVSSGDAMVPVGFLGMPLLVAGLIRLVGVIGSQWFTPLLVLSVVIPLLAFTKKWGTLAQMATVVTWLSFPTVILYANRGLFPNLVVVCLAVWSCWLVTRGALKWDIVAGTLAGIALAIRPTEIIWFAPWLILSVVLLRPKIEPSKRIVTAAAFFNPLLLVAIVMSLIAWKTYGHPFAIGYELHDPVSAVTSSTMSVATSVAQSPWWPFGFHPRNVWWNVHAFLLGYLAPLTVVLLGAGIVAIRRRQHTWLLVGMWTVVSLCLLYGQGLYQDNIQINAVTLGNSFLRYTLPLSVLIAFSAGFLANEVVAHWKKRSSFIIPVFLLLIVAFGWWTAFSRDNEGIVKDRAELERYVSIRESASRLLPNGHAIILSDRSDKIFFPAIPAASPMPSMDRIADLSQSLQGDVLVFIRTADDATLSKWNAKGMNLVSIVDAGNESLYVVK